MSTTLNVLHVLMAGHGRDLDPMAGRDTILGGGLLPGLDPILADFWSGFPCPPPWNHGLLFRVNWTACVGKAVGERLKWFMASRCNIPQDENGLLPDTGDEDPKEELEAPDACALPCIISVSLACLLFTLLVAGIVFCVCRKRPKNTSPTHQSALNAHPENAKYYTSCHYASAPVMTRPLETTLHGDRTETRILNGVCSHPSTYPHPHDYHLHMRPAHVHDLHLPLLTPSQQPSTSYGQQALPPPPYRNGAPTYRKLDGDYNCSNTSHTNSDKSHIYESIGDGESVRNGESECSGSLLYGQSDLRGTTNGDDHHFCECECNCYEYYGAPPTLLDGYYSDRSTQTLPIRPLRQVRGDPDPAFGGHHSFDIDDSAQLRPDSRLSNRSRRRTSSGSHYSDRSVGNKDVPRRNIPALHPNYFDPPDLPEPAPNSS